MDTSRETSGAARPGSGAPSDAEPTSLVGPGTTPNTPDPDNADGDENRRNSQRHHFPLSSLPDLRETLSGEQSDASPDSSREEFTTVYDIIDQLEASLENAKGGLFSANLVKVDRESFAGQLNELKAMLPIQLERASALMREAERRLENAQSQASAVVASAQSRAADMVKDAQDQAQFLAGQENVTDLARQKARTILDNAQNTSDRLTQGADRYCTTLMEGLQQQLNKLNQDVQAGLNVLEERRKTAAQELPHLSSDDYPEA